MKKLAFLLLACAAALPLRAQTAPSSPTDLTDDTTPHDASSTGTPYHLRMPQPLDHKPDSTTAANGHLRARSSTSSAH
jgi:hypothetical protein